MLDRPSAAVADWQDGKGRTRSVGVPGMSAIPKALGAGLDIRQGVQVTRLQQDGDGWLVEGAWLRVTRVVVTVPAPQVAGFLGAKHPLVADLAPVRLAPCLTQMAAGAGSAPFVTRQDGDDPMSWIAQDNTKPGRPRGSGALWVAQWRIWKRPPPRSRLLCCRCFATGWGWMLTA